MGKGSGAGGGLGGGRGGAKMSAEELAMRDEKRRLKREQKRAQSRLAEQKETKDLDVLGMARYELGLKEPEKEKFSHADDDDDEQPVQEEEDSGGLIGFVKWLFARPKAPPKEWETFRRDEIENFINERRASIIGKMWPVGGEDFSSSEVNCKQNSSSEVNFEQTFDVTKGQSIRYDLLSEIDKQRWFAQGSHSREFADFEDIPNFKSFKENGSDMQWAE